MNARLWIASAAAVALAYGGGAAAASAKHVKTHAANSTIKVTGCLERNAMTPKATGTSGSTAPATSTTARTGAEQFVLTNAHLGTAANTPGNNGTVALGNPASGQASAGSAATEGGAMTGASPATNMFVLDGKASQLRAKTGNEVEVTGRLEPAAGSSTSTTATSGATTSSTAATGTSGTKGTLTGSANNHTLPAGQRLRVQRVRVIAQSCIAR